MRKVFYQLTILGLLALPLPAAFSQCASPNSEAKASLSVGFFDKLFYYVEKIPEILHMNSQSYRMMKTGMKAQTQKTNSRMEVVELGQIKLYHPIEGDDNQASADKTQLRAQKLKEKEQEILNSQPFRPEVYNQILPSIDPIQLVVFNPKGKTEGKPSSFLVIQGQGRIGAMKKVFSDNFKVYVEVSDIDQETASELQDIRKGYMEAGLLPAD